MYTSFSVIIIVVVLAFAAYNVFEIESLDRYTGSEKENVANGNKIKMSRAIISSIVALVLALVFTTLHPFYNVWQRSMAGQADMAEAEANRQIKVREAQATRDSAELLAEAEILRAKGVAEANRIVADGLGGPEGYLRYLYIDSLKESQSKNTQVIYVPTEAGLPILEANRIKK